MRRCWPSSTPAALTRATKLGVGQEGVRAHRGLRRHDRQLPRRVVARRGGTTCAGAAARSLPRSVQPADGRGRRRCATARTRTRAPPSTASTMRPPARWRTPAQLQGKELSYNNIADADAAWECVKSFDEPACVIVKHANPCGVAVGASPAEAYAKAWQTDPTSAYGGIVAFNRPFDGAAAEAIHANKQFVEVLIAPAITRRGARAVRGQAQRAPARGADRADGQHARLQARRRRTAAARRRRPQRAARRAARGHAPAADRAAARRPDVRLEGGQVRQEQRDRLLRRRP